MFYKKMLLHLVSAVSAFVVSTTNTIGTADQRIIRIDRPSLDIPIPTAVLMKPLDIIPTVSKALDPTQAFNITLGCREYGVDEGVCVMALIALERAAEKIARVLSISQQITITARFRPFCNENVACASAQRLGSSRPATSFVVKHGDQYFMYSQALVKQLNTDVKPQYSNVDIIADFNSEIDWIFPDQENNEEKTDLELVAAHEFTHGCGFGSGFVHYSNIFANADPSFIAPLMLSMSSNNLFSSTSMVQVLEPANIFDAFVYSKQGFSFSRIAQSIASFGIHNLTASQFLLEFQNSGLPFRAAQFAYNISRLGERTLYFHSTDGKRIPLYSPIEFFQGSSISHTSDSSSESLDYIMIPAVKKGNKLNDILHDRDSSQLYGPDILAIMETIGWPTIRNPEPKSIQLALQYPQDVDFLAAFAEDAFVPVPAAASLGFRYHFSSDLWIVFLLLIMF